MPSNKNGKRLVTQQSVNATVKTICDIMRRSNCAGAMEYVPELSWLLFLRILDERETAEAEEKAAVGETFSPSLVPPYRWQDWAAPGGAKRQEMQAGKLGDFFDFLHDDLLPHLRGLRDQPEATPRQKIISEVLSNIRRTRIDTEYNMWEVIDKVHEIKDDAIDTTHIFPLSQVYEGLLLTMGEKRNDGGQFFTPREVIRAMVRVVDPRVGKKVYDPGCGTGGFLAQAYEYMSQKDVTGTELDTLKHDTFFGREKDNTVYPIALANLVLHGIDQPNLWHGNTLTGREDFGDLFRDAPAQYEVILTNPPFGGKEGKEAQTRFAYKTSSTQVLFLQHVIDSLAPGGACGIVVDEGVLFRTNESAFVKTKKKLLDECNLWCIVSLPGGVFTQAGAGVKTNLLFFTKGEPTERIWYYDLSHLKIRKRTPLTLAHFDNFFAALPDRADSEFSWTIDLTDRRFEAAEEARPYRQQATNKRREAQPLQKRMADLKLAKQTRSDEYLELQDQVKVIVKEAREFEKRAQAIEDAVYDLKAVNPNTVVKEDTRTPDELLDIIEAKGREVAEALAALRR
ncbi:MAG: N-6 DNA methylase [Caldilineales bacterium]|nr:N-6 DNA methylase [Caldilineales bacterium]